MAARQLGMSGSAVTRYVGTLEAHLNTRLLNRNTRSLSLTEIGNDYFEGCRSLIEQLEELESSLLQASREVGARCALPRQWASLRPGSPSCSRAIVLSNEVRA